jgi:hypothetical protein
MAKDNWMVNAEDNKRCFENVGLSACTPRRAVRTVTVSKTRAVESDYAMPPREEVQHTARFEVFSRNHVAVEQDDWRAFTLLDVMKSDAVGDYKAPGWRMFALGFPCMIDVVRRHCCQRGRSRR